MLHASRHIRKTDMMIFIYQQRQHACVSFFLKEETGIENRATHVSSDLLVNVEVIFICVCCQLEWNWLYKKNAPFLIIFFHAPKEFHK